jgi:hypothetical protein
MINRIGLLIFFSLKDVIRMNITVVFVPFHSSALAFVFREVTIPFIH